MTARWNYWNGPDAEDRRVKYKSSFKPEYQVNGDDVQRRIAALEVAFTADTGIVLPGGYSSGWRPAAVNEKTSNAGKKSTHLEAKSGDKRDTPNGDFAWWCQRNPAVLEQHGLWMEHPVATVVRAWQNAKKDNDREPTPWCHLQTTPPGSGLRVYWPDSKAPGEWKEFLELGLMEGARHSDWRALQEG